MGDKKNYSVLAICFLVAALLAASASAATIYTDKADYAPTETVTITGSGFLPTHDVWVTVTTPLADSSTKIVTTDSSGNFVSYYGPNLMLGLYYVYATDGTNSASTEFTDATRKINNVTLNGASTTTVLPGATITVAVTTELVDRSWGGTEYKIGAPANVQLCVDTPDHTTNGIFIETFTITAPSVPGIYDFFVKATLNNDCTGQSSNEYTMPNSITVQSCLPTTEICTDTIDNDCDGLIDCADAGDCAGNPACTAPSCTTNSDCDDGLYCNGAETCSSGTCLPGTVVDCSDNLFCTVNERCDESADSCVTDARDCSANSLPAIATCSNNPDNNPFTWDTAAGFTSVCNEATDICTSSTYSYTHTCDVARCGAQCESNDDCDDENPLTSEICTACSCQYNTDSYCGDGTQDAGEACDYGASNGNTCTPAYGLSCNYCTASCQLQTLYGGSCGDGTLDLGYEQCEDDEDCRSGHCSETCTCESDDCSAEICDGIDNDCDQQIDEGFDFDGDTIADCFDNCPAIQNTNQVDFDGDGIGDACDRCPGSTGPVNQNGCDIYQFCGQFRCGESCTGANWIGVGEDPSFVAQQINQYPWDCTVVIVANEGTYYPKCVPALICQAGFN